MRHDGEALIMIGALIAIIAVMCGTFLYWLLGGP